MAAALLQFCGGFNKALVSSTRRTPLDLETVSAFHLGAIPVLPGAPLTVV